MDIRTPYIRTPYIGTPSIKAQSVGASLVTGATKNVIATPVIALTGNSVTITCDTTGATIYYTLDSSVPTSSSSQYSSAFTLDSSCTIKAIAIKGGKSSGIAEESYVKPITYLTQWKLMGNSTVHTDEYLTQWKVSGNSVVDNNTILSCGDLGQDGKYHVKISNGVTIYDIPLTEPLRKINDIADTIEFSNSTAIVTRNIGSIIMGDYNCYRTLISSIQKYRYTSNVVYNSIKLPADNNTPANVLCPIYRTKSAISIYGGSQDGISVEANNAGSMYIYDENYAGENDFEAFKAHIKDVEVIYELATPTTETIQVSPFPISPTDTYTSANDTPYSAFEYKKNVEIWSCGEYSEVDNKWHICILPEGYGIVDIALDEPLRKVNDVADSIEFANGVTTVTRKIGSDNMGDYAYELRDDLATSVFVVTVSPKALGLTNLLSALYAVSSATSARNLNDMEIMGNRNYNLVYLRDLRYTDATSLQTALNGVELIYELTTPTTEVIQVSQIAEAESYSCIISQGGKAVEWSSFTTE